MAAQTIVAATMQAVATPTRTAEPAPLASPTPGPGATPTVRATPHAAQVSPTARATLSPTPNPTPRGLAGRATGNVNCRIGPGSWYPIVTLLHAGDPVTVLGQATVEGTRFVQVREPTTGDICWALARFIALTEGSLDAVPLAATPPALPAAFSLTYAGRYRCGAAHVGVTFSIINRGTVPIESGELRVQSTNGVVSERFDERFFWGLDCARQGHYDRFLPGETGMITVRDLNPGSDTLYIRARMCTEDYLQGDCFERDIVLPVEP